MSTDDTSRPYWFRAKRYGWGWTPATWQGWVFTLIWLAVTIPAVCWATFYNLLLAYAIIFVMIVLMLIVCYKKGPPPKWRWGSKE